MKQVHEHGYVRLEQVAGSDLSIVNAARVSFNAEHPEMEEGDDKLIAFLTKNRHGSPFEHVNFTFNVKAPIFVFREWMRHRIGSFNEMSGRYTELLPEFYIPSREYVREQKGKPGAYYFEPFEDDGQHMLVEELMMESNSLAWRAYQCMLKEGIAKEVARMPLPVSIYSKMWWTVNLRSLMNFLSLRNHPHAQAEIRDYAVAIEEMVTPIVPHAMEAFIANGRIAP